MLLIQGGLVLTPEMRFERADVAVERGKITAVGAMRRVPKSAEIVEAHCHVSLFADGIDARFYDGNEMTDPVTPHVRAVDAVHPEDAAFADLRRAGITTISTSPGSGNLVGGQTAIVKTAGRTVEEMLVRAPGALKMALGENPKRVYGTRRRRRQPPDGEHRRAPRMADAGRWVRREEDEARGEPGGVRGRNCRSDTTRALRHRLAS